jgi:pyruvate kinase
MRLTKIVATVGPATSSPEQIRSLVNSGVDVLRLNCSHQSSESLRELILRIREVTPSTGILVDIQGPKLRFSSDDVILKKGDAQIFSLMDDGRIETIVESIDDESVAVRIIRGGPLARGKGVNFPDTEISGGVLSKKDLSDLAIAKELAVEMVAVSFVQSAQDILDVRAIMGSDILIFAKIERPQALNRIDRICEVSDGLMAARGDLGVEIPYESVPAAQLKIAHTALRYGVISICATEMLESMIHSTRPTRAEVSDISTAVRDGFDAVMLSGETAIGNNPNEAVQAMARICITAEQQVVLPNAFADKNPQRAAVTAAATALAKRISAQRILSMTYTGYSARLLASCRPACAIIAATPSEEKARQLTVCHGVVPIVVPRDPDIAIGIETALRHSQDAGVINTGDKVVICASRLGPRSDADTILLHVAQ